MNRREITTPQGNKISHPEEHTTPITTLDAIDKAIQQIEKATGRTTYTTHLNPDIEKPERLHDIKIIFNKKDPEQ